MFLPQKLGYEGQYEAQNILQGFFLVPKLQTHNLVELVFYSSNISQLLLNEIGSNFIGLVSQAGKTYSGVHQDLTQ